MREKEELLRAYEKCRFLRSCGAEKKELRAALDLYHKALDRLRVIDALGELEATRKEIFRSGELEAVRREMLRIEDEK